LDILAAINLARQPVTLTVSFITSASQPMAGRVIELIDQRTGRVLSGFTDANGQVAWDSTQVQLTPGSYDVRAQECAVLVNAGSVELSPGQTTNKTIVAVSSIGQHLPWISRR
jgi:hypothetical protein